MTEAILDTGATVEHRPDRSVPATITDRAKEEASERAGLAGALEAVRGAVTVATLLRTLGAAAIVGSLSLFLLQGFDVRGDFSRVMTLLGLSALMAAGGLAVGFALREPKGARVFLTLCLVSVPANFAVLGAMIYSIAPLDQAVAASAYPAFAFWEASSLAEAGRALAVGLALLVPLTAFAFAVLARRMAVPLSAALLVASATLLVPLRDPALAALAAGVLLTLVVTFVARSRRRASANGRPMTFEERLAHALLLLPPAILLGRSVLVHGVGFDAALPVAMAAYYLFHGLIARAGTAAKRSRLAAVLGAIAGTVTAGLLVELLPWTFEPLVIPLYVVLAGALLLRLGSRTGDALARRLIGGLWSALAVLAIVPLAVGAVTVAELAVGVAIALLVIGHGIAAGGVMRTVAGALALLGVLWAQASALVDLALGGGWMALAAIGIGTIVAGSLLERFGPALKLRAARRYGRADRADGGRVTFTSSENVDTTTDEAPDATVHEVAAPDTSRTNAVAA